MSDAVDNTDSAKHSEHDIRPDTDGIDVSAVQKTKVDDRESKSKSSNTEQRPALKTSGFPSIDETQSVSTQDVSETRRVSSDTEVTIQELKDELKRRNKQVEVFKEKSKKKKEIKRLSEMDMTMVRPIILPERTVRCHVCKELKSDATIHTTRGGNLEYEIFCCGVRSIRKMPKQYSKIELERELAKKETLRASEKTSGFPSGDETRRVSSKHKSKSKSKANEKPKAFKSKSKSKAKAKSSSSSSSDE